MFFFNQPLKSKSLCISPCFPKLREMMRVESGWVSRVKHLHQNKHASSLKHNNTVLDWTRPRVIMTATGAVDRMLAKNVLLLVKRSTGISKKIRMR